MQLKLVDPATGQVYPMRDEFTCGVRWSPGTRRTIGDAIRRRTLGTIACRGDSRRAHGEANASDPAFRIGPPVVQQITMEPYLDRNDLFYIWPLVEPVEQTICTTIRPAADWRGGPIGAASPAAAISSAKCVTSGLVDGHQAPLVPASREVRVSPYLQMPGDRWPLPRLTALAARWLRESGLPSDKHYEVARWFEQQLSSSGQFQYTPARTGARHVDRRHRRLRFQQSPRTLRVLCHGPGPDAPQPGNTVAGRVGLSLRRVARGPAMLPGPPVARARLGRGLPRPTIRSRRRCGGASRFAGCMAAGCDWIRRRRPKWAPRPPRRTMWGAWQGRWHGLQRYWDKYIVDMDRIKQRESVYEPISRATRNLTGKLFNPRWWRELAAGLWASLAAMLRSGIMGWLFGVAGVDRHGDRAGGGRMVARAPPGTALATVLRRPAVGGRPGRGVRSSSTTASSRSLPASACSAPPGRRPASSPALPALGWPRSAGGASSTRGPCRWSRPFTASASAGRCWTLRPRRPSSRPWRN